MRLSKVAVKRLFGLFDHSVPLRLDERVTIIHGPNGLGKTTLLRMINSFFSARYSDLQTIPFEEFTLEFDNRKSVVISPTPPDERLETVSLEPSLKIQLYESGELVSECPLLHRRPKMITRAIDRIVRQIPGPVRRRGTNLWVLPDGTTLTADDILTNQRQLFPELASFRIEEEWVSDLQKQMNLRFIESQRLLRASEQSKMQPAVDEYAKELAGTIQKQLALSGALSQSLDRTFPQRLVKELESLEDPNAEDVSIDHLTRKFAEVEDKRSRLREAGLLEKEEDIKFDVSGLEPHTRRVLAVYLSDVENKLAVFDSLATKIDLLKQIVNDHFQFKKIQINREHGYVFMTDNGRTLKASRLSSGEQHELVLLSELLFRHEPDTLFMIDEPEISLHVGWQVQFLKDIERITKLASIDVLIATHSPQIINDRWDLTVDLGSA